MKQTNIFRILLEWLYGISVAIVLMLIISWFLFFVDIKIEGLDRLVGLSVGTLMKNYTELMGYLLLPWVSKLEMTSFPTSISGASHFYEVKILFQLVLIVFLLGSFFKIYLRRQPQLFAIPKQWAFAFMIIPVIILPFAAMNFDAFFVFFHSIFFHNQDWLFDPAKDPIINVLTENFFSTCFIVFGLLYELYFFLKITFKHQTK